MHEKPEFKKNVLSCSRLRGTWVARGMPHIIRREQYNSECDRRMLLELLDNRAPHVRLLVQHNGLEIQLLQEPGNRVSCTIIVPVNDEDSLTSGAS